MFHIVHPRDQQKGEIAKVVIESSTPHRFTAIGEERLDMVCVHASARFIIEWLGD
jgi:mannose-6-phosphate isomerase-like protein (cupin superfamily)